MALRESYTSVEQTNSTSHEMDAELKAHIYQHLMDLQPYLLANAQVAVLVQRAEGESSQTENDEPDFLVTLVATLNEGRMEAEGEDADIYEAFNKAKLTMIQQLAEVQNSMMDPAEREVEVRAALDGTYTLH